VQRVKKIYLLNKGTYIMNRILKDLAVALVSFFILSALIVVLGNLFIIFLIGPLYFKIVILAVLFVFSFIMSSSYVYYFYKNQIEIVKK
jgi:hypothetical protein